MVKPFEDALFAAKAGDVIGPVKTEFGYHIIKVAAVRGGQGKSFEEVRDTLAAEQLKADGERGFNELAGAWSMPSTRARATWRYRQGSEPAAADPGPDHPRDRQRHRR